MKKKALMGLIATATIGSAMATPAIISNQNISHDVNNILMVNNDTSAITNEAVVINGNSSMKLYGLSNGSGIVSNLSTGEMLTILGQAQKGYCKVRVQETGAVGYINTANMQNILNGTNAALIILSENGQVINVSSNVRLRSNPSINASIIGTLTNGTNLNILGKQGQWYKVEVNGQTGFVYGEYISANGSNTINSSGQSASTSNSSNSSAVANSSSAQANNSASSSNASSVSSNSGTSGSITSNLTSASKVNLISGTDSNGRVKNVIVRTKNSGAISSKTNSKSGNISSEGYTYATNSELNNINGIYNFDNFVKGRNHKSLQDLTGITINSNGITLTNYITGNNLYESSAKMKVYKFTSNDFTTTFGVTPLSLGLQGNSFNVYAIGNVFVYQLPNKNIVFSFENSAGNAINTTNNVATSNVSKWYGTYTVGNKVGQINGVNNYNQSAMDIKGQKVVIESNKFKYENKTIKNPQYYIIKVSPSDLFGTSYSGADLTGANSADFLAVLAPGEKMSNYLYDALPSYTGCMSGAWAAGIAMPIILGPNGNIQVMNNNYEIYSGIKIDGVTSITSTSNITKSNSGEVQHEPGSGAHVNNMNNSSSMPVSSSNSQINNNNSNESYATFSLATINKNCSLYSGTPHFDGGPSLKLSKGGRVLILNNNPNYHVQKGWVFARTAMGAGYLPLTDFDITGDTKYNVKVLTKDCNLYADTNINTKMNLQINPGEQVFVPVNEPSSSKWVPVICAKTLTTFESGFLPSNVLKSTSRISQPA